jgi:hypothetical protein
LHSDLVPDRPSGPGMEPGGPEHALVGRDIPPAVGQHVVLTIEAKAWEMGKGMRGDSSMGGSNANHRSPPASHCIVPCSRFPSPVLSLGSVRRRGWERKGRRRAILRGEGSPTLSARPWLTDNPPR